MDKTVNAQQLAVSLARAGYTHGATRRVELDDSLYYLPARDWIESNRSRISYALSTAGLSAYVAQVADCDDYALQAKATIRAAHRAGYEMAKRTNPQAVAAGIAFGEIRYTSRRGGSHAANIVAFRDNPEPAYRGTPFLDIWLYEPQNQSLFKPTPAEVASCTRVTI